MIVNFGNPPEAGPPGTRDYVDVFMIGNNSPNMPAVTQTIINTRFTGGAESQRLSYRSWRGGVIYIRDVTMEPDNGIAIISHSHYSSGNRQTEIGTVNQPALVYATNSAWVIWGRTRYEGSVVSLNSWLVLSILSNRRAEYTWNSGFLSDTPFWFSNQWPGGTATELNIASWQEIPPPSS